MAKNGSPEPTFETDDNSYVLVTLPVHVSDGASDQVRAVLERELHDKVEGLLTYAANWVKREDLFASVGLSNHSTNRKKYLDPLIDIGWIEMEYPDRPTHPSQRYRITVSGKKVRSLMQ